MAAVSGLSRITQTSFSGGLFRNGAAELIPANGAYDISNGLLDLLGGLFWRGGSQYRSAAAFGSALRWIWDGWLLHGGHTTLLASISAFGRLEGSGAVTNLGEGGLGEAVRPAVYEGVLYFPGGKTYDGEKWGTAAKSGEFVAIVANRLLVASGTRIYFSPIGKPGEFNATDYHELPEGVQIIGLEGSRESAVVFTTSGIWVISNMADNLTDENGSVLQKLDHYSGDLTLWGDSGISAWEGSLIVPTIDGVWLIKRGATSELISSFERISNTIHDLYTGYVKAGYEPGRATVFNNHYLLPIVGGGQVVDMLVCRLDMPIAKGADPGAWTRLGGFGAQLGALTTRVESVEPREPELLGVAYGATARVLTLSYFSPSQLTALDADGSTVNASVITRSYPTGNLVPNLVTKVRVRYQMSNDISEPKLRCDVATDTRTAGRSVWGAFVWGVGTWASPGKGAYEMLSGEAPPDIEASDPYVWELGKKVRFVSFRLTCKAPTAQLALKAIEVFVRPDGRTI